MRTGVWPIGEGVFPPDPCLPVRPWQEELEHAQRFLELEMGLNLRTDSSNIPINFTREEMDVFIRRFRSLDTDNKGFITVSDLRQYFKVRHGYSKVGHIYSKVCRGMWVLQGTSEVLLGLSKVLKPSTEPFENQHLPLMRMAG